MNDSGSDISRGEADFQHKLERVYDFIRTYLDKHQGRSPSLREIADGCYLGLATAVRYVDILCAMRRISRVAGHPRSIRLEADEL